MPSLVAVMVAAPAVTPVTRPLVSTVATAVASLAQVTTRPVSGLPFASFAVAVSCPVCPAVRLAEAGLTATEATGTTVTVIAAAPLCPSLAAVTVAAPGPTPLTSPLPFTVSTAALLVAHVITRPFRELPRASLGVAVSCTVRPTCTAAVTGVTATEATATCLTAIAAVPFRPSLAAVIVAEPVPAPVTSPAPSTVATAASLVAQVTTRPLKELPDLSSGVATNCTRSPTDKLADGGVTATVATFPFVTCGLVGSLQATRIARPRTAVRILMASPSQR